MKVLFKVSDNVTVEAEADSVKDLYTQLHSLIETFGVNRCGCCKGENIVPLARKNGKFTFYEYVCRDPKCKARLSMGVKDDGSIYPRRKYHDDHPEVQAKNATSGDWLPTMGWSRWEGKKAD